MKAVKHHLSTGFGPASTGKGNMDFFCAATNSLTPVGLLLSSKTLRSSRVFEHPKISPKHMRGNPCLLLLRLFQTEWPRQLVNLSVQLLSCVCNAGVAADCGVHTVAGAASCDSVSAVARAGAAACVGAAVTVCADAVVTSRAAITVCIAISAADAAETAGAALCYCCCCCCCCRRRRCCCCS